MNNKSAIDDANARRKEICAQHEHERRAFERACWVFVLKVFAGALAGIALLYLVIAHAEGLL